MMFIYFSRSLFLASHADLPVLYSPALKKRLRRATFPLRCFGVTHDPTLVSGLPLKHGWGFDYNQAFQKQPLVFFFEGQRENGDR